MTPERTTELRASPNHQRPILVLIKSADPNERTYPVSVRVRYLDRRTGEIR